MAEVKNSFLQSKMNKDLDDRLIPNGEYRDALNISVGKSEDKDMGALEAVLGNSIAAYTGNQNLVCIGQVADNQNNKIFQFWTDYTAPLNDLLSPATSGDMRITVYDPSSNILTTLVSGVFLNFANNRDYRIYGSNILEDLLFWTDNRNQPRKININKAATNNTYYTDEVQISVAKYSPVNPISVYFSVPVITTTLCSNPTPISTTFNVSANDFLLLYEGLQLISSVPPLGIDDYAVISNLNASTNTVTVLASFSVPIGTSLTFEGSSMTDKSEDPNWIGDPNYLKDKYVRFSYRYKFEDGEYSLMAPFTQILFIPNQNGYFTDQDENSAYRSTVLSWMENYINNAELYIELPETGNNLESLYKITGLDILYKESDSLAVKVLETVSSNQIKLVATNTNIYTYVYRSQKPYKTLPESQTVRVYDKVPIRAKAQEISGNRIIYGNFINQSTAPSSIDYNLSVIKKSESFNSWAEYPNHTLKQNRNYQAGIILADKFGRQSSVILSTNDIDQIGGQGFVGSTIYSPYYTKSDSLNVKEWRGNSLAMRINSPITSAINEGVGTPGLYAIVSGFDGQTGNGFTITAGTVSGNSYTYTLGLPPVQRNYPVAGNYLRGKYTDYVKVLPGAIEGTLTTSGEISDIYNYNAANIPDVKYSYDLNQLGWYSYKIVVRQQQQDYYNVYLPGMLNGYPKFQTTEHQVGTGDNPTLFPVGETNKTAHIVLLNDNINKIPRDLSEVGPDQKQYRSSVELFGRVENTLISQVTSNKQYYPAKKADTATTIATSSELNFLPTNDPDNEDGTASNNFYQLSSSPLIARISTVNKIGVIATDIPASAPPTVAHTMNPFLSVYETAPVVSLLDIFWESSSTGLISDLNADVLTGSNTTVGFDNLIFNHNEFQKFNGVLDFNDYGQENSPYITGKFQPVDSLGVGINVNNITMTVADLLGNNRTSNFILETFPGVATKYAIKIANEFVFLIDAAQKENYIFTFNIIDSANGNAIITKTNKLNNSYPIISYPTFQNPIETFTIPEIVLGPIILCDGTNGAPNIVNSNFNKQQLQWSVINPPLNWNSNFTINPASGVISLTSIFVPPTPFPTKIRLTDAYNFSTLTPGNDSLFVERDIIIIYPTEVNHCGSWQSETAYQPNIDPNEAGEWYNNIYGKLNFWKLMLPGEIIDVINTSVILTGYGVQLNNSPIFSNQNDFNFPVTPLQFSTANFDGTFQITYNQISLGEPAHTLYFAGTIRTSFNRIIPINISSTFTFSPHPTVTIGETCTLYIPTAKTSWRLVNSNTSVSINWNALEFDGITVIGGAIFPGEERSSATFYGGAYNCIKVGSLTFGTGGVASFAPCP